MRIAFLLLCVLLTSCDRTDNVTSSAAGRRTNTYDIEGEVISVVPAQAQVVIHHKEIPGFMMEMTMPFSVRDPRLLEGLSPGDKVQGELMVAESAAWLTKLKVTQKSTTSTAAAARQEASVQPFPALRPADLVPPASFVDQDGTSHTLADYSGKALCLTFIFTRCPMPQFCPAITANFGQLQRHLAGTAGASEKVHLISVSLDPAYDTSAVLREYGKRAGADFRIWSLVRMEPSSLPGFAGRFGIVTQGSGLGLIHNMRTALISPRGELIRIIDGALWNPREVARELLAAGGR